MGNLNFLDWALIVGVFLLGYFLAVYFKKKYRILKREFFVLTFYVAALAALIIGIYHLLRGMLTLTP